MLTWAPAFAADQIPSTSATLVPTSCLLLATQPTPSTPPLANLYLLQPCAKLGTQTTGNMVFPMPPGEVAPLCATALEAETITLGIEAVEQGLDTLPMDKVREAFANIVQWFGTLPKTLEGK
jgi:hypothetical protein